MNIIKKEILEFSERETDAIMLITEICAGLMREADNPRIKYLSENIYYNLSELWGYEE